MLNKNVSPTNQPGAGFAFAEFDRKLGESKSPRSRTDTRVRLPPRNSDTRKEALAERTTRAKMNAFTVRRSLGVIAPPWLFLPTPEKPPRTRIRHGDRRKRRQALQGTCDAWGTIAALATDGLSLGTNENDLLFGEGDSHRSQGNRAWPRPASREKRFFARKVAPAGRSMRVQWCTSIATQNDVPGPPRTWDLSDHFPLHENGLETDRLFPSYLRPSAQRRHKTFRTSHEDIRSLKKQQRRQRFL